MARESARGAEPFEIDSELENWLDKRSTFNYYPADVKHFLSALACIIALSACAPRLESISNTPYLDRNFTRTQLLEGGVSVLPVLVSSEQFAFVNARYPELMPRLSQRLGDAVTDAIQNLTVVSSDDVARLVGINEQTIAYVDGYFDAARFFDQNGVLRPEVIEQVLARTETRFAVVAYWRNASASNTNGQQRISTLYSLIIWDNKSKKSVFISTDFGEAAEDRKSGTDEQTLQASLAAFRSALKKLQSTLK